MDDVKQFTLVLEMLGPVEQHVRSHPDFGVTKMQDVAHFHDSHGVFEATLILCALTYPHRGLCKKNAGKPIYDLSRYNTKAFSINCSAMHKQSII